MITQKIPQNFIISNDLSPIKLTIEIVIIVPPGALEVLPLKFFVVIFRLYCHHTTLHYVT